MKQIEHWIHGKRVSVYVGTFRSGVQPGDG